MDGRLCFMQEFADYELELGQLGLADMLRAWASGSGGGGRAWQVHAASREQVRALGELRLDEQTQAAGMGIVRVAWRGTAGCRRRGLRMGGQARGPAAPAAVRREHQADSRRSRCRWTVRGA